MQLNMHLPLRTRAPVTRPKTRTALLDNTIATAIRMRFGTLKNAYAQLKPSGMTQDVFQRVAAVRPSLPAEVQAVGQAYEAWKKANLK